MKVEQPPESAPDAWTAGDAYERFMGRWGRLVARSFVPWVGIAPAARWLDVGCGTGALTSTIIELAQPAAVLGVDPSEAFLSHARGAVVHPAVTFAVGGAERLPAPDGAYDVVVSGLVLNFVSHPGRALAEWHRVTRPRGVVAACVWDYSGQMQLLRCFWDAAVDLDAAAYALDEGVRFPIARPSDLMDTFEDAGLTDVTTHAIDVVMRFADFDDLWLPFLGGQGPAPSYVMRLPAADQEALRDRLRARLPIDPDGAIELTARAWAVRGTRP